jgi:predicted amidophosphoribosyltransferase
MAFGWGWLKGKLGRGAHSCPECHAELAAERTYCEVCGYDLVRKTRDDIGRMRGPV